MNRKVSLVVLLGIFSALGANAAGTYYSGNYTSPQRNYATSSYATRAQNANYSRDTTYTRTRTVTPNANAYVGGAYQNYSRVVGTQPVGNTASQATIQKKQANDSGFYLNAGLSHEFAAWNFDMNTAGSKLHYDNIRWNVFDIGAKYKFGAGSTPLQIDAGFKYGIQFGDSTMIDDDITNGGYFASQWYNWDDINHNETVDEGELVYLGDQYGHSLSIGSSSSGNMMGFYAGFGLTDAFKFGGAKITPSIGYRYLRHKLETKNDYGLTVDTGYCETVNGGDETQCDPIVIFLDSSGENQQVMWGHESDDGFWNGYWYWNVPSGYPYMTTAGTYMFRLPGTSHSYETTWAGPYIAMDLNYDINVYNSINARVEFGLPLYTSTGDQPYRPDWQHPKSVEDKGGFGDAWHFGFGANYMTALTESVSLSLGFTFDYYSLSGGEASTYWNSAYWTDVYNELFAYYQDLYPDETAANIKAWMDENDPTAIGIIEKQASGWVSKVDNEIESIYKSLGIRIGINARF